MKQSEVVSQATAKGSVETDLGPLHLIQLVDGGADAAELLWRAAANVKNSV